MKRAGPRMRGKGRQKGNWRTGSEKRRVKRNDLGEGEGGVRRGGGKKEGIRRKRRKGRKEEGKRDGEGEREKGKEKGEGVLEGDGVGKRG